MDRSYRDMNRSYRDVPFDSILNVIIYSRHLRAFSTSSLLYHGISDFCDLIQKTTIFGLIFTTSKDHRGGLEVERSPRMREIGVRSPVGTDLSRLNR